jgi:hypothetical protein
MLKSEVNQLIGRLTPQRSLPRSISTSNYTSHGEWLAKGDACNYLEFPGFPETRFPFSQVSFQLEG